MKKTSMIWCIGGAITVIITVIIVGLVANSNTSGDGGGTSGGTTAIQLMKVGDYVDYKAPENNSYVIKSTVSGIDKDQTLEVTGKEKWRVLGIEDGEVSLIADGLMVSKYGDRFEFKGKTGYDNAINTLNEMAKIYVNDYARDARSMRLVDLVSKMNLVKMAAAVQEKTNKDVSNEGSWKAVYESACKAMNTNYGVSRSIGKVTETINNCFSINYTSSTYSVTSFLDNPVYEELFATTYGENRVADALLADSIISIRDNSYLNQLFFSYSLPEYMIYPDKGSSFQVGGFEATDWYQYDQSEGVRNPATGRGGLKPIVVLKTTTKVAGGDGTAESPWTLAE